MKNLLLILCLSVSYLSFSQQESTEQWRPAFHFSPARNWTNDPNGLVYHDGEWHIFYQHNPFENKWGHMSWGHAVSKDLMHWQHLPVAIPEDSVWIFSGGAVVDPNNTSGFGANSMVAIYTADYHGKKENQHLAYSTDKGRTWTKYQKNPIIPVPLPNGKVMKDFRDPNMFWHEPTKQWILVVVLPTEFKAHIYGSKNLTDWTFLSEFGGQGDVRKIWECPSLIELPIEGEKASRWVLMLSSSSPHEDFVGMQYFVGDFDGKKFTNDNPADTKLYVEYGKDFYAAIPFTHAPKKSMLGWMASWQYTDALPTFPWKGQMSLPREIALKRTKDGLRLLQKPTEEVLKAKNWKGTVQMEDLIVDGDKSQIRKNMTDSYMIEVEFELNGAREVGVKVLKKQGSGQETVVGYQADSEQLYINRINSGKIISPNFASLDASPMKTERGMAKLQIFVDKMSVEVFGNDGEAAVTSLVFPETQSLEWQLFSNGGKAKVTKLKVWEWQK
ncbi:glycoside hydrolase family 32 protein [Emticicia fluvialis]|uniref:glycoside hydrolase family 32 protein n=1 Tax=Emticicia fluvialis TaxID=2974474 RepID=UPI0021654794|nr:glycoside hydrolase family 32 protein [Emticicia fluvialis]